MAGRDITKVIDRLVELAPELGPLLASTRSSACFSPPENQHLWWEQAQDILTDVIKEDHPKYKELLAVWCDTEGQ